MGRSEPTADILPMRSRLVLPLALVLAFALAAIGAPAHAASRGATGKWSGLEPVWFVGDSLAVGMYDAFGRPKDSKLAFIGARSHQIVPDALTRLADDPTTPRLIVVSLGTNNSRKEHEAFRDDVEAFLSGAGNRCVIWLTIHRSKGSATWNALNTVLLRSAPRYPAFRLLDWNEFASFNDGATSPDGIHISSVAYPHLRKAINQRFQRCLKTFR